MKKASAPADARPRSKSDLDWKEVTSPLNFDSFSTDSGLGSVATDTSQVSLENIDHLQHYNGR